MPVIVFDDDVSIPDLQHILFNYRFNELGMGTTDDVTDLSINFFCTVFIDISIKTVH
jgi:hypothetical protein